jgi:hypothetical protein
VSARLDVASAPRSGSCPERARRELLATSETVRTRSVERATSSFDVVPRCIDAISITMGRCPPGVPGLAGELGALGPADVTPHAM